MRVISAYLLAVLGGNSAPSADDITKILGSVGVEAEAERVATLISELAGKDLNEIIASGMTKLAAVPSGGGGGGAAAAPKAAAAAPAEAKKAAVVEESEEEDMGFSLFD
jgi:large subunit ribosomal protein LP2